MKTEIRKIANIILLAGTFAFLNSSAAMSASKQTVAQAVSSKPSGVRLNKGLARALQAGRLHSGALRPGDVIVAVNGQAVNDAGTLAQLLYSRSPGKFARLHVERNGKARTVRLRVSPTALQKASSPAQGSTQ